MQYFREGININQMIKCSIRSKSIREKVFGEKLVQRSRLFSLLTTFLDGDGGLKKDSDQDPLDRT